MRTPWRVMIYFLIVMACHGLIFYQRMLDQQREAGELKVRLARAELETLKIQLQPHFLYNTLNTISELIHDQADTADQMLVSLAELLRRTVKSSKEEEISLAEELELLHLYLSIQRARFEDRLRVEMSIGPETMKTKVPSLILQPLVENALKHGVASRNDVCQIGLSATVENSTLVLNVLNNTNSSSNKCGTGVGLSNTRERLLRLYGSDNCLHYETLPANQFSVTIRIPIRSSDHDQSIS